MSAVFTRSDSNGIRLKDLAMRIQSAVVAVLASGLLADGASAHHAYAMFDINREVTLHGVVKAYEWTSPHIWVEMLVRDNAGKETEWPIEGASPTNLRRFGWGRMSMKPGDQIEMVIHPRRDGGAGGSLVAAVVNGQVVGGAPKV